MTDIVKQLRDGFGDFGICAEAADEIERLRKQVAALMNECTAEKEKK